MTKETVPQILLTLIGDSVVSSNPAVTHFFWSYFWPNCYRKNLGNPARAVVKICAIVRLVHGTIERAAKMGGRYDQTKRCHANLRDARAAHLSEAAEGICGDEIAEFEHYLSHNELGLALDSLEVAVFKSPGESQRVFEFLRAAAENMGLSKQAARFRAAIESENRGAEEKRKKPESQQ